MTWLWWKVHSKKFYISLCVTKRHFECSKSSWKSSGNKAFWDYQTILIVKNVRILSKLFFHCTRFFFFWFGCSEIFLRTFLWSQRCSYIPSNHLYHLLIRLKVQNCHGGKKGPFFPRDEVNVHFRQDLFRLKVKNVFLLIFRQKFSKI